MTGFNKILFPVDMTGVASVLVDHALTMAKKFEAELHVLFVVGAYEDASLYMTPSVDMKLVQENMIKEMLAKLKKFTDENFDGYDRIEHFVSAGHTSRQILKHIQDNAIDLVVMGTKGRRGLDKVFFGSVAQRVVQGSTAPVMTINPYRMADEAADEGDPESIPIVTWLSWPI